MRALRLSIGGRRWLAPAGGVYIAAVLSTPKLSAMTFLTCSAPIGVHP